MFGKLRDFIDTGLVANKKRFYILLTLLILAISLSGLNGSLQNVDESIFSFTSRDSLEQGSWLVQIKRGEETFFKSPMMFWMTMLSYKALGVSDFAGKLPSALMNIGTAFALFFICLRIFKSYKTSFLAVLIYESALQVYISSHQVCTDVYYQAFLIAGLLFCIKGIDQNPLWFMLAGVANGLVFLSKSALGLVLPATLLLFIIFDRRWRLFPYLILLFVISLAVALPFFLTAYLRIPEIFKQQFIDLYLLNAVSGERSLNPLHILYGFPYFFALLIAMMLPFSAGWIHVLFRKGEEISTGDIIWSRHTKILSLFFLTSYVGFSVIRQRLPHYTLPMIPALSLFVAHMYCSTDRNRRLYLSHIILAALALVIFSIFTIVEGSRYPTWIDVAVGLIAVYLIFIGANALFFIKKIPPKIGTFATVLLFFITFAISTGVTVPMDFNRDLRNFAPHYNHPAPLYVIHSRSVNEGGKSNPLYWYMRKKPEEFRDFDEFTGAGDQIERGSYIIFNRDDTEALGEYLPSFRLLQTGKIWNMGIYE